jgi:hypothetical protein
MVETKWRPSIRKPDTKSVRKMTMRIPDGPVFRGSLYFQGSRKGDPTSWNCKQNLRTERSLWNWSRGGFHKSWAHGLKRKAHPNLGKNAISWAYGASTWWLIREKRWVQSTNFKRSVNCFMKSTPDQLYLKTRKFNPVLKISLKLATTFF